MIYARAMKSCLLLASILATSAWAQSPGVQPLQFKDYPVTEVFKAQPVSPVLETSEERKFEAEIRDGIAKGWGVFDGATGKEFRRPGPNFAGHFILVIFGCGEPTLPACFSAAIVDAKTSRVYRAPSSGSGFNMPYFGVFAARPGQYPPTSFHRFPLKSPLVYRLSSRLLIANVCGGSVVQGRIVGPNAQGCDTQCYLMDEDGLKLIFAVPSWVGLVSL
jgi:hypothetical protein